jgi:hypothetical protein
MGKGLVAGFGLATLAALGVIGYVIYEYFKEQEKKDKEDTTKKTDKEIEKETDDVIEEKITEWHTGKISSALQDLAADLFDIGEERRDSGTDWKTVQAGQLAAIKKRTDLSTDEKALLNAVIKTDYSACVTAGKKLGITDPYVFCQEAIAGEHV